MATHELHAPSRPTGGVLFGLEIADAPLDVVHFHGREAISEQFEFHVEVAAAAGLDPDALLGRPAALTIDGADTPRVVHGFVSAAAYVGHTRRSDLYELTIQPWTHRLMHRSNCRIFQERTTEQIVGDVLRAAGIPPAWARFALAERYAPRDYCVQYRETDLEFIARLLEEDGIFYFFEHAADHHVWVMADHPRAHTPIAGDPALWFGLDQGGVQGREQVHKFRFGGRVVAGKVSLRDFNLHSPGAVMEASEVDRQDVDLERYDYPGEFQDPGRAGPHQGQAMAKIRLAELHATRHLGLGESDCPRLTPGRTLALVAHPRHELNTEYRILSVTHVGHQPQVADPDAPGAASYTNSFTVTALAVPFRPARTTPRPVMRGLQTATVVGPEGEEVHVDRHGRVRVQFHWDRLGRFDEHSTTWVRVGQLWAGNGYGTLFIPRIGHEVLVDFLEGDPDRPLVVGQIYHGQNTTPYPLPEDKTRSTIRSESSPGGGGYNELRFEDRKGAEEVYLHAQHDLNTDVLHAQSTTVGADRSARVGADDATRVGAVHTVTITRGVDGVPTETEIKLQDTFFSVTTGAARIVINGPDIFLVAEGNITLAAGGEVNISSGGPTELASAGPTVVGAGGDVVIKGSKIRLNPP